MKTDYNHDAGHNIEGYTPKKRCRWLEDISDTESHCSKGYPPDIRCWTGSDNPCWAYMADTIIHETHGKYKITQHPIHGLYLVSSFDEDTGKWLGLETCYTPAECHQVIKRCENTSLKVLP